MIFDDIFDYVQNGFNVRRKAWMNEHAVLSMKTGFQFLDNEDLKADDWEVLDIKDAVENIPKTINEHEVLIKSFSKEIDTIAKHIKEIVTEMKDTRSFYLTKIEQVKTLCEKEKEKDVEGYEKEISRLKEKVSKLTKDIREKNNDCMNMRKTQEKSDAIKER